MEDLDALWQPLADVAIEQGCDVVRVDNVEEVQRVVAKQGRLMAQMKAELKDEVEAQTLGRLLLWVGIWSSLRRVRGCSGTPWFRFRPRMCASGSITMLRALEE